MIELLSTLACGKGQSRQGRGKAFETRQKIVGFIFVRKALKIDLSRLILLLPEAFERKGGEEAGGRGRAGRTGRRCGRRARPPDPQRG